MTFYEVGGTVMIFETIAKIISEQLGHNLDEIQPDTSLVDDLGADSLDAVEVIMAIEEEFSIEIPDEKFENLETVQDIVDLVETLVQA